jgi:hypothetical protein
MLLRIGADELLKAATLAGSVRFGDVGHEMAAPYGGMDGGSRGDGGMLGAG